MELAQLERRAIEAAKDMYEMMLKPPHTQDDLDEIAGLEEAKAQMWVVRYTFMIYTRNTFACNSFVFWQKEADQNLYSNSFTLKTFLKLLLRNIAQRLVKAMTFVF